MSIASVPYQLPYRIMLPAGIDGLLAPVAVSATHLGFGTIRMEPTWMALGEAAGTAAALAVQRGVRVRDVPRAALQRRLVERGAVIAYLEDVPPAGFPGHDALPSDLAPAAQFWGAYGFFLTHRAQPDAPLSQGEAARWRWLIQRAYDPWRRLTVEPATFAATEPVTRVAFLEGVDALLADPSPLRRELGVALPQGAELAGGASAETISRGEACRLLYRLFAAALG